MNPQSREIVFLSDQDLESIDSDAVALVPLGSIEPHGHLPLATDTFISERILRRTLECTWNTWLFPTIPVGHLFKYGAWRGGIGTRGNVLADLVTDIAGGLANLGILRLFVMSGHDENREPALLGLREASRKCGSLAVYCDWLDLGIIKARELSVSRREGHGSELQTSVMLFLFPELDIKLPSEAPDTFTDIAAGADELFAPSEGGTWVRSVPYDGRGSYTGAPSRATAEAGRALVEHIVCRAREAIISLQREPILES